MNILEKIYDILAESGTETYFAGQHEGDCISPYVVIKTAGVMQVYGVSSEHPLYDILIYVPKNQYSKLEGMREETKKKLKKLFPLVSYAGVETESHFDESNNAHMISIQYQGIRKLSNL